MLYCQVDQITQVKVMVRLLLLGHKLVNASLHACCHEHELTVLFDQHHDTNGLDT